MGLQSPHLGATSWYFLGPANVEMPPVKGVGVGFQKDGWSCGYDSLHLCDVVAGHRGSLEDVDVILTPLPKGFIKEALCGINANCSVRVPGTIPENGWEGEVRCWKPGECPLALASDSESPPPSTSPLLFDEKDPLSQPEGNIAASSSEPIVGESPSSPRTPDGKSVKGNVEAPPQTPQSTSSSNPPTSDDARPYVLIRVLRSPRRTQRAQRVGW